MKKFGLIGSPIAHSLSPKLFKAGYGGRYTYELIEGSEFEVSYRTFINKYDGINVTTPFKEKACAKAEILSEECKAIGAANILVKTPAGIKAFNSDYLGVRKWLCEIAHPTDSAKSSEADENIESSEAQPKKVLIAGCGGAGKAAAQAALSLGMRVTLINRDKSKAIAIAKRYHMDSDTNPILVSEIENLRNELYTNDILIYTIPTALDTLTELDERDFKGRKDTLHILEANYLNPSFRGKISGLIENSGGKVRYTGGKTWLLYQAETGYEIFTGETPDLGKMSVCLQK